ncbi:50S ribosomal protein L37ae [Candidatus Woesearchaeota archaeon]|nr:50S ribosomal protein L37ae [Candidatus Woesearchaeota archaeon]
MAGKIKNAKGFGARYGRKIRSKLGKFLNLKNKDKKCPYCSAMRVKRIASGIWTCTKCESKFTGRAYDSTRTKIKANIEE